MRRLPAALGLALSVGAGLAWLALGGPPPRVPAFETVRGAFRPSDVALLDRHGEVVHEVRVDPTRRRLAWTPLAEVSPALQAAVLASEDRRFYRHGGVDARALAAAAARFLSGGPPRGASTISMQVAALVDRGGTRRDGPRTLGQKWRQIRLARALESRWSKSEILEAYLNLVSFRGELGGVAAASAILFDKAPHGLTGAEAAVLAALLRGPNATPEAVTRRAARLAAAAADGTTAAAIHAAAARALAAPAGTGPRVALAPHAAARLVPAVRRPGTAAVPVRSTLDASLQRVVAETLRRQLLAIRARHVQDGAVLVADNATGEVLAYVAGSADLASARHVDGIRARRQAGSALKPFLYGLALEQRLLTPASALEDTPLEVAVAGGLYRPRNYDEQFKGLVTVRTALASSLNVPAVRTLDLVGGELFVRELRRLGFDGVTESGEFYGPALALGSAEVSLWELTNAYRALANGGAWTPLTLTPGGSADGPASRRRIGSEATTFLVSDILAGREGRSATFGLESPLATRFWTAVKTGTSKEMRDNWCVGYSRRYTVGVWVGNFSGEPMREVSGTSGAAPVWREVMAWLHRATPSDPPSPPAGVVRAVLAGAGEAEWFHAGTEPAAPPPAGPAWAGAPPRILAPVAGTIVALDPDIPAGRQRVAFEREARGVALRWRLDGADLGAAGGALLWAPVPGRHTLALVDLDGRVVDAVLFEVRGQASAHAD
ncbi:MAG: penicillin-binding protein 1C [Candidatus Rokubacteria bacterium]|nr:penicillin-binding protein 1C [Candidatus Rokubacteria bacterium]